MSVTSRQAERDWSARSAEQHSESPLEHVARDIWNSAYSELTKVTDKILDMDLQALKALPRLDISGLEQHMQGSKPVANTMLGEYDVPQQQFRGELDFPRTDLQGEYDALPLTGASTKQEVITGVVAAGGEQQLNQQDQQLRDNSSFWHTFQRTLLQTDLHQQSYANAAGGFQSYMSGGIGPD